MPAHKCSSCGFEAEESALVEGLCPLCLLKSSLARSTLRVSCPHCGQPVEIEDESCEEIPCPSCGKFSRLDAGDSLRLLDRPIKRLGRFELLRVVGTGGFGTVWQALDTTLNRTVAVKMPRGGRFASDAEESRFLREGRLAAQLHHPGIVTVHEVDRVDGHPLIISEFVDGVTLEEWLRKNRPTFRQAAEWAARMAEILDYSHRAGVVHRDLKPANVIMELKRDPAAEQELGQWTPRIMDFGMAKRDSNETTLTLDGHMVGTPVYMGPEQIRASHRVDGRADIYSLGVILYEMLTAELPFIGTTEMVIQQILHDDPRTLRSLNGRIPLDLETIALKCIEKEPSRRYATAADLKRDLEDWFAGRPIRARPISAAARCLRWARRKPGVAALLAALAFAIGAGFAGVFWQWQRAEESLRETEMQRMRAEANFRQARRTVDEFLNDVERRLGDTPAVQPLRRELMERALKYYQEFVRENPEDPGMQRELAGAFHRIGTIMRDTGPGAEALKAYAQGLEVYAKLRKSGSWSEADDAGLAMLYQDLGTLNARLGRSRQAMAAYRSAREYHDRAAPRSESPDLRVNAAYLSNAIGLMQCELGMSDDALANFDRALAEYAQLRERYTDNADVLCGQGFVRSSRGRALVQLGRSREAAAECRSAIPLIEKALALKAGQTVWKRRLATAQFNLAIACAEDGRPRDALEAMGHAVRLMREIARENPGVAQYEEVLANFLSHLGNLQHESHQDADAMRSLKEAMELQQKWLAQNPFPALKRGLARSWLGMLEARPRGGARSGAVDGTPLFHGMITELLEDESFRDPAAPVECGEFLGRMAVLEHEAAVRMGDATRAREEAARAVERFQECRDRCPQHPRFRRELEAAKRLK